MLRGPAALATFALLAVGLAFPASAGAHHWTAGACGLPGELPLRVEYAEVSVSPTILDEIFGPARPPLVLASSGLSVPPRVRALGAHTAFWEMKIERRLGTTGRPADPATIVPAADRLYERAVASSGCSTPLIALNELQGNWLPTPWSVTTAQYRANALALVGRLHERGAHPFLMVTTSPRPYTDSLEAAEWWRQAAAVSDLVLQVHFDGPYIHRQGPVVAGRLRRSKMRRVLDQFAAIGIPPARLGLLHGFQSGHGFGGREGLRLDRWLRVVKWEALAAKQVLAERAEDGAHIGSDWSWGWGDYPLLSRVDPDKHVTACVWLWARDPELCDGPGRAAAWGTTFNTSLSEGRIRLAPGVHCEIRSPRGLIASVTVDELAAVGVGAATVGRARALTALLAWLVDSRKARIETADVLRAEQTIVARRFGGSRTAYEAALTARRATVTLARALIADGLRRALIRQRLPRGRSFASWMVAEQSRALATAACRRDELPGVGAPDLTAYLPFLRPA